LGGALLRQFSDSTCGIARWQPKFPRAIKIIDENLQKTNEVVEFWQARDPDLFSFLDL
jgi:phage tail protein X